MTRVAQDHAEQHGALVPCEGLWADFFLRGYCPLLAKGEGPEPLRQRALTILSRLYRQWSSVIYAQLQQFQAQWIRPSLSGGVKHRDSVCAAWEVAQALETAVVAQTPHYTGLLDTTKYFDRFDWDVTWHVALCFGFLVALVVLLNTFYRNLSRTFKVAQNFGLLQPMVLDKEMLSLC